MKEIQQKTMALAIEIVQCLHALGHQISVDGDVYVVHGGSSTINGKTTEVVELWCGRERCTAIGAMNVIQRYHHSIINM